jgi:transposase
MAIGHMTATESIPRVWETNADIARLQQFLKGLKGCIVLTLEESTAAHWLYGKLVAYVDRLIVCDPTFNRLLCRGPKNDLIDAGKLCLLLRQDSLKEVYHSTSTLYDLRLLVSAYEDTIRSGVAAQNRLKARLRARLTEGPSATFVIEQLQDTIDRYKKAKQEFEQEFHRWAQRTPLIRALAKLPGIGERSAVKIVGTVIDARRFPTRRHYDSYCGLVWHQKKSGGHFYGRRRPQYSRLLKSVYKTAALAAIHGHNKIAAHYQQLLGRGLAPYNARHASARYISHLSFGILKNGIPYDPNYKKNTTAKHNDS